MEPTQETKESFEEFFTETVNLPDDELIKRFNSVNTKNNPYLEEFNKNFGFNLELGISDDFDQVDGVLPVDLINNGVLYSIVPVKNQDNLNKDYIKTQYQIIGFKYHSGNRENPPEMEDYIIYNSRGDNFNSFDQGLIHVLKLILEEKFNNLITFVKESILDENNLSLEESF